MKKLLLSLVLLIGYCSYGQSIDSLFTNSENAGFFEDDDPVELGMVFKTAKSGSIMALKCWKGSAADVNTYTLNLYKLDGTRLFSSTNTYAGKSGWMRVETGGITVDSGASYVVSFFTKTGIYGGTQNYFKTARTKGNLTAPASTTAVGNGRYKYGGGFPSLSFNATNYWADVVFKASDPVVIPPVVRRPLVVNAKPDTVMEYTYPVKDSIRLSGIVTGDSTWFEWTKGGTDSTEIMWRSQTLNPVITNISPGYYEYYLTGHDKWGMSLTDTIAVSILPDPEEVIMVIEMKRNGTYKIIPKGDGKLLFFPQVTLTQE